MKKTLNETTRHIEPASTKGLFNKILDFEIYWRKHNEDFIRDNPAIGTLEEAEEHTKATVQKMSSNFKEGDEIIHFDDHNVAPRQMEREYLLLRRNGEIIKSVLIRMS